MRPALLLLALACGATVLAADPPAAGGAAAIAVVKRDGKPALNVTLPPGWTAIDGATRTVLKSPTGAPHVEIWPTAATSVEAAVKDAPALIVEMVTDFKPTSSEPVDVAGGKGTRVAGPGSEADDGDPSNAQASFFAVDGVVWVMLAHGEGEGVLKQQAALRDLLSGIVSAK